MSPVVLDTSALLALRDDEPGADRVAALLAEAANGRRAVLACFITEMELWYRVWKDEGEVAGRAAHATCRALPIQWVPASPLPTEDNCRMELVAPEMLAPFFLHW